MSLTTSSVLSLESRVLGAWRGKSAGGTLGLPAEGRTERQHYQFYDPIPTVVPPNDDLELQLVWLDKMENHTGPVTIETLVDAWRAHIHYMWDEYGRARWNIRRGVPAALNGIYENPFASGMGSPIRSEVWAIIAAGNPDLAERYAKLDSMIDHGSEGVAGEVFLTVLQALVLGGADLPEAMEAAWARVDPATETRRALDLVFASHKRGMDCWATHGLLLKEYPNDNFTHAPLNVALTLWAILFGNGDFEATILLGVNGGYDTDCTAASAGAVLGFLHGAERLPEKWIAPLGDAVAVGPGIIGIRAPRTLQELTERSLALHARVRDLTPVLPEKSIQIPALQSLPGSIMMIAGNAEVPWANGELPTEVKATGRATWQWRPGHDINKPFKVIALAREGCRLWINGQQVIECPAGVPYVPATHRSAQDSHALFVPDQESYEVRLELNSANPWQEATVLLADNALHIAPWDGTALPHRAELPPA